MNHPCPFCGHLHQALRVQDGGYQLRCGVCGAMGPLANNPERAQALWAMRMADLHLQGPAQVGGTLRVQATLTKRR